MKKLIIAVAISLVASVGYAACLADSGICWESGKASAVGLKLTLPTMTTMQMEAYSPSAAGELFLINGVAGFPVCISTGTGAGAFTVIMSTANSALSLKHCN